MTNTMLSYHNDPAVKARYIARFAAHRAADEVVQGEGFVRGRGCFVGCTLDKYKHDQFPVELGWPEWLAHVADVIFEGLPESEAAQFGTDLLETVPVGVCLEPVQSQFLLAVQRRSLARVLANRSKAAPQVVASIKAVICLLEKDEPASSAELALAARLAARLAAELASSAGSASASRLAAASAAELARSAGSAESAAVLATWSARLATWSAAWSARSAESAEYSAEIQQQRDDLLAMCSDLNQE